MLDLFHLPSETSNSVREFTTPGTWLTWQKPRSASMAYIFTIGGGGGGGGGSSGLTSTIRAGGGGAGSAGVCRLLIPLLFLPSELFINVGVGGAGGAADNNGSVGEPTWVCTAPDTSAAYVVLGGNTADFGDAGTTSTGTPGSAAVVFTTSRYTAFGNLLAVAGVIGSTGGVLTGTSITPGTTTVVNGGTGGGGANGSNSSGTAGSFIASGLFPAIAGGAGNGAGGANGSPGMLLPRPLGSLGGTGGGAAAAGTGGNGGRGFLGSGGGGAGGGLTGGRGGDGGSGYACIISW